MVIIPFYCMHDILVLALKNSSILQVVAKNVNFSTNSLTHCFDFVVSTEGTFHVLLLESLKKVFLH